MAGIYGKKTKVPISLGGKDCYFFYCMACGAHLSDVFGSPDRAHKAYYSVVLKTDDNGDFIKDENGNVVGRNETEIFSDKRFYEVFQAFVHAMTLSWAKENKTDPIDFFDLSTDDAGPIIAAIATAFGLAMPKADGNAKKDPQKP